MDTKHMSTGELLLRELDGYIITEFDVSATIRRQQPIMGDSWERYTMGDNKTITIQARRKREPAPEANTTIDESSTTAVETSTTTPHINVTITTPAIADNVSTNEVCRQMVNRLRSTGVCV